MIGHDHSLQLRVMTYTGSHVDQKIDGLMHRHCLNANELSFANLATFQADDAQTPGEP